MTRKTLLRVLLALFFYKDQHVARFLLPTKYKRYYLPPWVFAIFSKSLAVLQNNTTISRLVNKEFTEYSSKIGDSLTLRRPVRLS